MNAWRIPIAVGAALVVGWSAPTTRAQAPRDPAVYVASLSGESKRDLKANLERFERLEESEREKLRSLHRQLAEDKQSAELRQTLRDYHTWLAGLSDQERIRLRRLPTDERLRKISDLRRREQLTDALQAYLLQIEPWARKELPLRVQEPSRQPLVERLERIQELPTRERTFVLFRELRAQNLENELPVDAESLASAKSRLPADVVARLDAADVDAERRRILREAFGGIGPRGGPGWRGLPGGPERIEQFMESLSEAERKQLENAEAGDRYRLIRKLYGQRVGLPEADEDRWFQGRPLDQRRPTDQRGRLPGRGRGPRGPGGSPEDPPPPPHDDPRQPPPGDRRPPLHDERPGPDGDRPPPDRRGPPRGPEVRPPE